MAEQTPLEKLEAEFGGDDLSRINSEKDDDGVPTRLAEALAVINGIDADQMETDLQEAAISGGGRSAIIVDAKPARGDRDAVPAKTIQNIIDDAKGTHIAMAKLIDRYIEKKLGAFSLIDDDADL